ncbi:MAG: hypothetical protein MRY76_00135 [Pseudomonadales bacterium]|jgi:hypothetical protein|nr:hypothetical protein [Pseudomonadales bacterium]
MSDFCSVRVEDGISIIHFTHNPGRLEFIEAINELALNYPYQYRLWDLRDVVIKLEQHDLRAIVSFVTDTLTEARRAAFVTSDNLSFGKLRMLEAYQQQHGFQSLSRIFRDFPQAWQWLLDERAAAD